VLTLEDDPGKALLEEVHDGDIVVMGTAAWGDSQVSDNAQRNLASMLASHKGVPMLVLRASDSQDLVRYEFRNAAEIVRLKEATGQKISIGLLTSNDARHMSSTITGLNRVLREMHSVADQIVLVDAGSTDGTAKIARSLGAEVYQAEEVLPQVKSFHGRGESWWKSLAVMTGDLLVWLDPRARRFHPRTALAMVGPLLRIPELQLVKAFVQPHPHGRAERPGPEDEQRHGMVWGGSMFPRREVGILAGRIRVQSLRPQDLDALTASQIASLPPHTLLQVLYPPLAAMIAPFGRDMAARREAMLDVPVLTGDYNKMALLISVASRFGMRALAQVEVRHALLSAPPVPSLTAALDILEVLALRLPDAEARKCAARTAERVRKEVYGATPAESAYEVRALGPVERRPMREVLGAIAAR
jgi:hypothetical protein